MLQGERDMSTVNASGDYYDFRESQTPIIKPENVYIGGNTNFKARCPTPPVRPEFFGGRDVPLAELTEKLKAGQTTAIVAVAGLGGIGKTTLAKELANVLHEQKMFKAVLWADIGRELQATVTMLENWAVSFADDKYQAGNKSLDVVTNQVKSLLEALIAAECADCPPLNRTLVVLDDVWDNGLDLVRTLKQACPANSTVLITSRSRNVVYNLKVNDAAIQNLDRLTPSEAADLLRQYLPTISDTSLLEKLGAALGGHPLALTLAATRINKAASPNKAKVLKQHLAEYQQKLPIGIEFQKLKLDQAEGREDNLTLVLSYSYAELAEADRARFRALGVLAYDQPFDKGILAALWDLEDEEQASELEAACDTLRLLSLLEVDPNIGTSTPANPVAAADSTAENEAEDSNEDTDNIWYQQHPLLQTYALALLKAQNNPMSDGSSSNNSDTANELELVERRYQKYITEVVTKGFKVLAPENWNAELGPYLPHVHKVGESLVALSYTLPNLNSNDNTITDSIATDSKSRKTLELIQLFALNVSLYIVRRREVERELQQSWMEMGLTASQSLGNQRGEAIFYNDLGLLYIDIGEPHKALDYHEQALLIDRVVGNKRGEAAALNNMGMLYSAIGESYKSLEYYKQALSLTQAEGDRGDAATILTNMGRVYNAIGEKGKALECYEQTLPIFRADGNRLGEAATLLNMGWVYDDLGEKVKALEYYEQALPIAQAVGDKRGEATTLNNMGVLYYAMGNNVKALEYYKQALPMRQAGRDRGGEAITLNNIGNVYSDMGEKRKALEYYKQALPIRQAVGDRGGEAVTLSNIGSVYLTMGNNVKALEYYKQALPILRAVGNKGGEATTLINIGGVYYIIGEPYKALEYFQHALPILRVVGDKRGEATTLNNIGMVYRDIGEPHKALEYYEQALPILQAVEDRNGEAHTLNNMGGVYSAIGDNVKAFKHYNQALPIFQAVKDKGGEAATLNNIGWVYSAIGDNVKALEYYKQALTILRAIGDKWNEVTLVADIAVLYYQQGRLQQALMQLSKSIKLAKQVHHPNLDVLKQVAASWNLEFMGKQGQV
jgi:tetratricopeptide (TPR) repeat protein